LLELFRKCFEKDGLVPEDVALMGLVGLAGTSLEAVLMLMEGALSDMSRSEKADEVWDMTSEDSDSDSSTAILWSMTSSPSL
jgi:hypothetical protein